MKVDILISGGGVAGLTAACAFGTAGYRVLCVDPTPPVTEGSDPAVDLRTTAFLQPARAVLAAAGLWDRLAPHSCALQVMRIVDAAEDGPRVTRDFVASEVSDDPFGWNLPNWLLRREMLARLGELPNVAFRPGIATRDLLAREAEAIVTLSDGTSVRARLLIAADGRDSPMRAALGIGVTATRTGQKALTFAVSHPVPHGNVSTEVHRSGGPFTLVPLPDRDGLPASAVVWMERGAEAQRLLALPDADFEAEASARSAHLFGPLRLISRRSAWPILTQVADRLTGPRAALIAEAAHVLPPIGAQGLNMSLADIAALLDLATPETLGDRAMLDAYARRHGEIRLRAGGIDLLNRASMAAAPGLTRLRSLGIEALHGIAPVRRGLMKAGLGVR